MAVEKRSLSGSRLLVVGASSGIGRAIAVRASRAGGTVVYSGRRENLLRSAIAEGGGSGSAIVCDVRDPQSCESLVAETEETLGGIDHLVIATGAVRSVGVEKTDAEVWQFLLETNLVGPALVARAALPALEASRGTIVFMSSVTAAGAWPGMAAYAAAKKGLESFAEVLAQESPHINVCSVIVGATATDIFGQEDPDEVREWFRLWRKRDLVSRDRMLPEDVADTIISVLTSPIKVPEIVINPKVELRLD